MLYGKEMHIQANTAALLCVVHCHFLQSWILVQAVPTLSWYLLSGLSAAPVGEKHLKWIIFNILQ